MTVTTRQAIDASFSSRGWTYDRGDELWRDRDSQLIDLENLIAALPPDASLDELADYEWWISHGNVS
jgi:hypothetical protein